MPLCIGQNSQNFIAQRLHRLHIWLIAYGISFWLTSLSMIISRSIHAAADGIISFFLWLSNIPLYYIYHIFFIHSSASVEHLLNSKSAQENVHTHIHTHIDDWWECVKETQ